MKQEVTKSAKIPAFRIDVDALGVLIAKLSESFSKPDVSIGVEEPNKKLRFESHDELKSFVESPDRITDFTVWITDIGHNRRLWVSSRSGIWGDARIYIIGDSQAWCAGLIEVALNFFEPHKVWYRWIRGWGLIVIIAVIANLIGSVIARGFGGNGFVSQYLPALGVNAVLSVFLFRQESLLPGGTIEVHRRDGLIRQYAGEISLVISIIGLIATIYGLFK